MWDTELVMTLLEAAAGSHFQERISLVHFTADARNGKRRLGCVLEACCLLPAGHSWAVKMSQWDRVEQECREANLALNS